VLQVGNQVMIANPTPMPNYRSDTLDRTFEMLYFVQAFNVGGQAPAMGAMGAADGSQPPVAHTVVAKQEVKGVAKADGGHTVGDIYAKKGDLAGKTVKVRGKVVKFTGNIMGTNWVHIQDGTGKAGENDLTVTTSATATVGDVVTVSGMLSKDKDFGMGYFYPVIVENASITK